MITVEVPTRHRRFTARPGQATNTHSCNYVRGVPSGLRSASIMKPHGLSTFYQKYTEAYGIPILCKIWQIYRVICLVYCVNEQVNYHWSGVGVMIWPLVVILKEWRHLSIGYYGNLWQVIVVYTSVTELEIYGLIPDKQQIVIVIVLW